MRNMANNAGRFNPKPRQFGILERSESIVLVVDTQFNVSSSALLPLKESSISLYYVVTEKYLIVLSLCKMP